MSSTWGLKMMAAGLAIMGMVFCLTIIGIIIGIPMIICAAWLKKFAQQQDAFEAALKK